MKFVFSVALVFVFVVAGYTQSQTIPKSEYDAVVGNAVRVTNEAFPFIFTVVTETYEKGKLTSSETMINERQAAGVERITTSLTTDGKTLISYQVRVEFGNVYCSTDGKSWNGPQQYECPNPKGFIRAYGPTTPESVEYSVTPRSLNGQPVKVYREYAVFAPSEPGGKKNFREKVSTVDKNGFFLDILGNEGTLTPRIVTLTRKQTWTPNAKFASVEAPK